MATMRGIFAVFRAFANNILVDVVKALYSISKYSQLADERSIRNAEDIAEFGEGFSQRIVPCMPDNSLFISYFQFFKFGSFLEISPSFVSR